MEGGVEHLANGGTEKLADTVLGEGNVKKKKKKNEER